MNVKTRFDEVLDTYKYSNWSIQFQTINRTRD